MAEAYWAHIHSEPSLRTSSIKALHSPSNRTGKKDSSPAAKVCPIQMRWLRTMPPPVPVPSTSTAPSAVSARAPVQASALAAHLPSLATVTGQPSRPANSCPAGVSRIKGKAPPVWAIPVRVSIRPGIETAAFSYRPRNFSPTDAPG